MSYASSLLSVLFRCSKSWKFPGSLAGVIEVWRIVPFSGRAMAFDYFCHIVVKCGMREMTIFKEGF